MDGGSLTSSGRVLVTGAAGMIGSALCARLAERGADIVAVDRRALPTDGLDPGARARLTCLCRELTPDKSSYRSLGRFDAIVHLAANTQMSSRHDWRRATRDELALLDALADPALLTPGGHFLFASSSAVYGRLAIPRPATEDDTPCAPISGYAATKVACEALLSATAELDGLAVTAIRPSTIASPRMDRGVIVALVEKAQRGERLDVLGDRHQSRNFIHVDDVTEAILLVLDDRPSRYRIVNIASGEDQTTTARVAEIVCAAFGTDPARVTFGQRPSWPGDVAVVRVSIDRLRALGFKPRMRSDEAVESVVHALARQGVRVSQAELERQGTTRPGEP